MATKRTTKPKPKTPQQMSAERIKKGLQENDQIVKFKIEGEATAFSCAVIQAAINLKCYPAEYVFEMVGRINFKELENQFHTIATNPDTNQPERMPTYLWLEFVKEVNRIRKELCKPHYDSEKIGRTYTNPEVLQHFEDELKKKYPKKK